MIRSPLRGCLAGTDVPNSRAWRSLLLWKIDFRDDALRRDPMSWKNGWHILSCPA